MPVGVYVIDEEGPVKRFGFAYGALAEHEESGEERFTIEWNRDDDKVWYYILAFSRPRQMLAILVIHFHGCFKGDLPRAQKTSMVEAASGK
jgi:uncharacterized protein (UPF0548 family)